MKGDWIGSAFMLSSSFVVLRYLRGERRAVVLVLIVLVVLGGDTDWVVESRDRQAVQCEGRTMRLGSLR